jgi:enoyl-CoA hydratase
MSYQHLLIEHRGQVSWLYLNRPQALNAISFACMQELRSAWMQLRERAETRVIVVSGKGRGFCAGADLTDVPALNSEPGPEPGFLQVAAKMEEALLGCGKPVIAAVNGTCCGGGLELALMCDFIIAADSAKIGDAHANFGALPGGGATVRLPRAVGLPMARFLMYTGDLFPASQLVECGLVTRAVPAEALEAEVQAIAEKIAAKSPVGVARMKSLLGDGWSQPDAQAAKTEKLVAAEHMRSWDAAEGGRAFAEKRKPAFRGY